MERSHDGDPFKGELAQEIQFIGGGLVNVLVIDIGGTHVKVAVNGRKAHREFESGQALTPARMVEGVRKLTADWDYEVVSMGYPGPVHDNRPAAEPWNLGKGWIGFNFASAFERPIKIINDAAMQALGSYRLGKMLFLGLGTGMGSALIVDGAIQPMELAHLPYKTRTFEDYVGIRGLEKYGTKNWRHYVMDVVDRLKKALQPDEVVLGGGNVHKLKELPPGCRLGDNASAFKGGFRLWEQNEIAALPDRNPANPRNSLWPGSHSRRISEQLQRLERNRKERSICNLA